MQSKLNNEYKYFRHAWKWDLFAVFVLFVIFFSCASTKPPLPVPPEPIPVPIPVPPKPHPEPPIQNPTSISYKDSVPFVTPEAFGAIGDGKHDDGPAYQNMADYICANQDVIKAVVCKSARYKCNNPILFYRFSGTNYNAVTIDLIGQSSFWQGSGGTVFDFSGNSQGFGIGIQNGKGSRFIGLEVIGSFHPPALTGFNFFNCSFQNYTDGVTRDKPYSPNAGIVIDPFGPNIPSDGGYPGYSNFYRGGTGGSTGTEIIDCYISNFVAGLITSPNGQTSNAELLFVEKIQFENVKVCIVGCQAQEKVNKVSFVACWGNTHTFFMSGMGTGGYGNTTPGNWYIENVNIAGSMVRFCAIGNGGYFPSYFKNIYIESCGQIGVATGSMPITFEDCSIDLTYQASSAIMDWQFTGTANFRNSSIRVYGGNYPVTLNGGSYDHCYFETVPFAVNASFRDCSQNIGATNPVLYPQQGVVSAYGNTSYYYVTGNSKRYIENKYGDLWTGLYEIGSKGYVLIFGNPRVATIAVTNPDVYQIGLMAYQPMPNNSALPIGVITSINGNIVTISYICPSVISGNTYGISCAYPVYQLPLFSGDIVLGSNIVNNVSVSANDMYPDLSRVVGNVVKSNGGVIYGIYGEYTKILSINGNTMTLLSKAAMTKKGNIFKNYTHKSFIATTVNSGGPSKTEIFDRGDEIKYLDTTIIK
ncbi:MAG TPA: hypothetical protein VGZ90_13695 [Puia sp.]|jgi:hypothetical protein|nr:hypothetical protein [Puia sp.]